MRQFQCILMSAEFKIKIISYIYVYINHPYNNVTFADINAMGPELNLNIQLNTNVFIRDVTYILGLIFLVPTLFAYVYNHQLMQYTSSPDYSPTDYYSPTDNSPNGKYKR